MSKRRVLAIVLPHLACELVRQRSLDASDDSECSSPLGPLVVIYDGRREDEATAQLDAVDDVAWRVGIRPGQKVVEASALASRLIVGHVTTAELDAALGRVAELALSYGALSSIEHYDTVWLDITGAAHLVGGESSLAEELRGRIRDLGHSARVAISDGPRLSQAIARWSGSSKTFVVPPGQAKPAMAPLPIKALPISTETVSLFFRLGVMTVADLVRLPRAGLSSRLARSSKQLSKGRGAKVHARSAVEVATVLDLAHGYDPMPLVPFEPPRVLEERVLFDDPGTSLGVEKVEALLFVLRGMTSRMAARLSARAEACTRIELDIEYDRSIFALRTGEDAPPTPVESLSIDLPAPLSRESDLLRSLRARLERVVLQAPAVGIRLVLPQITRAHRVQMDLSRDVRVSPDALPALLAELSAELGSECVGTLERVDSHRPEHRARLVPVVLQADPRESKKGRASSPPTSGAPPVEPTRMLTQPVPLGRVSEGAVVSVANQLWSVEQATMTYRLDGVGWWTRDAVSRDYARVWLSAGRDAPVAEAMVFWDRSTGEAFLQGWWE